MLAYLALETFPVEGAHILVLGIWWLLLLLGQYPVLQALEVDKTDSTLALASNNQWIGFVFLRTPTNSALNIILSDFSQILDADDFLSFLELLIVEFSFTHHNFVALEIFDSESNSSKFDGVKFLNLVIVLSSFIFQRAGYEPEPIHAFLFLVKSCGGVIKIISFLILFEQAETAGIGIGRLINNVVRLVEIDLIIVAYYLPL
jgi:hypothetical protein